MLLDCQSCVMRDKACSDCVVTLLLGPMPAHLDEHRESLDVLAKAGLVPPLRLIQGSGQQTQPDERVVGQ